jgi:hypothetical protein
MAEDPNTVFVLRAISILARDAFSDEPHNKKYYEFSSAHRDATAACSRESTPATTIGYDDENNNENIEDEKYCGYLLRFTFD